MLSIRQFSVAFLAIAVLAAYFLAVSGNKLGIRVLDGYLTFYALTLFCAWGVLGRPWTRASARKNRVWIQRLERVSARSFQWVCALSLLFFLAWTLLFFLKHYSFNTDIIDSGVYSNVVFNSSEGRYFYSSHYKYHSLGEHFSPIVLIFVPLFWIEPSLLWMIVVQAAAIAVGPVILYFILKACIEDAKTARMLALFAAILWLSFPALLNALGGFHPSTLAPPFILLAFYLLVRERWFWFWGCMLFLLLFKENLSLVWIAFGLYAICIPRRIKLGLALLVLGALWGIAVTKGIIPYFRGGAWEHPGRLGPTSHLLLKLKYLIVYVFLPIAFLPLADWRTLPMIAPPLALNLAVKYKNQFLGIYHYDDILVPLLFAAAVYGFLRLRKAKFWRRLWRFQARYVMGWFLVPLGFAVAYPLVHAVMFFPGETQRAVAREVGVVKERWPDRKIHMQYPLGAHLNLRPDSQPLKGDFADWKFEPGDLVVLAPALKGLRTAHYWEINDYPGALKYFSDRVGKRFKKIDSGFRFLVLYEVLEAPGRDATAPSAD